MIYYVPFLFVLLVPLSMLICICRTVVRYCIFSPSSARADEGGCEGDSITPRARYIDTKTPKPL